MLQVSKKKQVNLPYFWIIRQLSRVGIDSDQLIYFLLSALGRKYPFSILASKKISQELSYWQSYRDSCYLIALFHYQSSLWSQVIDLACLNKQKADPDV